MPQPPSASSPRSGPDGPAQGARCSPPPASIARDSGTAPKSRAEAGGPNLPQPIQKRAGAPTADPKTPPIPTSQPPAQHAPPRSADGFRGPGTATQGAGSDLLPQACEAANARQYPSHGHGRPATPSARTAQPKAASGPTPGAPTTAHGSPTTPHSRHNGLVLSGPCRAA